MKYIMLFLIPFSYMSATVKTPLVNIKTVNPTICVELAYATPDNFTHEIIYDCSKCYLLQDVAMELDAIQKELSRMVSKEHPKGLGLKIWDGYRPLSAQKKMWDACAKQYPDEKERGNYVSNPTKGRLCHARGTSFDVTIIDIATGKELDMGTPFDEFSKKAWKNYDLLSVQVKKNRTILDTIMAKHGFSGIASEWWHYDFSNWQQYEPLDIALCQLD
jgi:zinc D-Ala-D-Ala dipeptidase